MVEKLWLRNPHLVSGCFLLAISVIVIYATFEIKYLYIWSKKECNDFSFMLIRDVLADEEKGFIRARWTQAKDSEMPAEIMNNPI